MTCEFHKAGCKGRARSVGEAVDVTCTEHNYPPDQASNKAKKLVSSQYSLSDYNYLDAIKYSNWTSLVKYMCFYIKLISWQIDLVRVDLVRVDFTRVDLDFMRIDLVTPSHTLNV